MEMKKYKLGEIATFINGRAYAQHELLDSGKYKIVRVGNLSGGNNSWYFSDLELEDDKYCYQGDLLYAWACNFGPYFWDEGKTIYHYHIWKVIENPNLADKSYLYYLLKFMTASFTGFMHGSTMIHITKESMEQMPIFLPSLESQQKIAAVLSSLDDKIALNRRMNAKLEQMAKRLYDHWFVQFDFPNADGKPYKASGGKMEYNEVLKREIPEGWEVKSVNDISISYRGVGYSADDEKSVSDKDVVLILRGNNISNNHIVYDSNTVYLDKSFVSEEQKINKFDIVMTMSSGSKEHVGKSAMFMFDSPHSYGAFCNKITPNKECQFFLENYLHSEFFKKYIKVTCSGTGINNLTNEHFSKAFFAFPIEKLLEYFNEKVGQIYEQIGVLEKEIQKLTVLRDRLLPLLMNGQVEVK